MAPSATSPLKVNQKVHALKELVGVPRGTSGKVLLIGGVSWRRYWVDFENGVSMPGVDRTDVGPADEWARQKDGPQQVASSDEAPAAQADPAAVEGEPVGGIPSHLLERSKRARERLGANS